MRRRSTISRWLLTLSLFAVTALVVGAVAGPGRWVPAVRAEDPLVDPAVLERVQREGHARVLVELRLAAGPAVPEGLLPSASAAASQRGEIAALQAQVQSRLQGTGHQMLHAYSSVPLLAVEVDGAGLAQLEAAGALVGRVRPDGLHVPMLPQATPLVQGPQAWAAGYDGTGTAVAILDTGVDKTHPFLANKVVAEACFSSNVSGESSTVCPNGQPQQVGTGAGVPCGLSDCWHGTHVAGIATGNGDQAGQSFSGVAKNAQIVAIQVFSQFTTPYCGGATSCVMAWDSDIIAGLEQVYNWRTQFPVAAANLSLGGGLYTTNCDSEPEKPIIDNLRSVGIATVIAAGNGGATNALSSPGCISSAISVGATTKSDTITSFTNAASFLDLFAPGESILSSLPGGSYAYASGTSMATPFVTGAFAILRQAAPNASIDTLLAALQQSGLLIADTRSGGTVTKPRIQIAQALQAVNAGATNNPLPALSSLSPSSATAGAAGFTLTVTGSNFAPVSVVQWNGANRSTTYVNGGQLQMTVTAADLTAAGSAIVTVMTPAPGGGTSNTVTFTISAPVTTTLSVTKTGNGSVTSTPTGITCGATCTATYASGQSVTLQATPAQGSTFAGWGGACSGTGACSVTLTANTAVSATFSLTANTVTYNLTVTKSGPGSGTVTSSPSGINCGSTCVASFPSGQQVSLRVKAIGHNQFAGWTGACSGTGACTVTMTGNTSVGATFTSR